MKRDMDLIREILLKIEEGQINFPTMSDEIAQKMGLSELPNLSQKESDHLIHNLWLIEEAGLVIANGDSGEWRVQHVTWNGHDFIDSIRDDEIWKMTKDGVKKAGGFTFELFGALAKGFIKKKIKDHTDIDI